MTDDELDILRAAAIGLERGPRAGEWVRVRYSSAARSSDSDPRWRRVDEGVAEGYVDNLQTGVTGTVMIYGRDHVWALRFGEVAAVAWHEPVRV